MLSHTRMGVPYEYTHMGRPIRVWANIRIWGRTATKRSIATFIMMFENWLIDTPTPRADLKLLCLIILVCYICLFVL